jgi:hypothetical protein
VNGADLEIGVEQEQTFAHGRENVFSLLAGGGGRGGLLTTGQ